MPVGWKRFLFVRVPLAVAVILVLGQGLAVSLDGIPLRRSYMDDLALAVERDRTPHRVVLLGDSITLMSTRRFELGRNPQDVANLATIAWTGAAAELFLLERYLASHPAPQYVLYASAADDLQNNDSPQLIHYYDWNVYTHPQERAFLRQYVPGIDARERLPAVLDVQENVLERLLSLLKRTPPAMPTAERAPRPDVQTEPASENRMGGPIEAARQRQPLILGTLQEAVFSRICQLSLRYGFQLEIVWPPLPATMRQAWEARGAFKSLDAQIQKIFEQGCNVGAPFDVNSIRTYTNFNRDGFHLHGEGWEERYAADLSSHIAALPDRQSGSTENGDAPGRRSGLALSR